MTLVADLLEETRSHLGLPETLNLLAADLDDSTTTVALTRDPGPITTGTTVSVDFEDMHVWDVDKGAKTLTVRRGHNGTTATAHTSALMDTGLVRAARHSPFAILRALDREVRAVSGAGIFAMRTLELTTSATGVRSYDLAADVVDVYDVLVDTDDVANVWPRVASWTWRRNQETSEFASGSVLRLDSSVPTGRPLRVVYKAALSGLLDSGLDAEDLWVADVEDTTGLRASAHDILPLGAAWRLTAGAEIERNQTFRQGDSRRAEEVPPGAQLRSALGLQQARQQRLSEELRNQQRDYPSRRSDVLR